MKYLTKNIIFISIAFVQSVTFFGQTFDIMSYNIRYDNKWDIENSWENRKGKLVQLLDYYNSEIFGIQEGLSNQVHFIDSCLSNYNYIGVGREDGVQKGEFSAIFFDTIKFSVLKDSTFWLSETPDTVSVGWDAVLERICTYGLFEDNVTREKIWIFNTHFDHKGILAREKSSELILNKIDEINKTHLPVILMGDLNSTPSSGPIQKLKTELNDVIEISSKPLYGPIGTFNGFDKEAIIDKRIDYFFTSGLKILSVAHIDDRLDDNKHISDHLPIHIKISINKNK